MAVCPCAIYSIHSHVLVEYPRHPRAVICTTYFGHRTQCSLLSSMADQSASLVRLVLHHGDPPPELIHGDTTSKRTSGTLYMHLLVQV